MNAIKLKQKPRIFTMRIWLPSICIFSTVLRHFRPQFPEVAYPLKILLRLIGSLKWDFKGFFNLIPPSTQQVNNLASHTLNSLFLVVQKNFSTTIVQVVEALFNAGPTDRHWEHQSFWVDEQINVYLSVSLNGDSQWKSLDLTDRQL